MRKNAQQNVTSM